MAINGLEDPIFHNNFNLNYTKGLKGKLNINYEVSTDNKNDIDIPLYILNQGGISVWWD